MSGEIVTRFAPSPTGLLHKGHAYAAFYAFERAQGAGGEMLLRIEDIDQTRCRLEFETAILEDLNWLDLQWPEPVRRQSDHFTDYQKALEKLISKGLVYRCFKTRKEVLAEIARAPHLGADGPEGPIFKGTPLPSNEEAALIESGKVYAWRLNMQAAKEYLGGKWDTLCFHEEGVGPNGERGKINATPEIFGDVIIARKDVGTSYHIAAVHDDALQDISHVIRGQDLFFASHLHRLLQELLELPSPIYHHHKLLLDANGKKFSKRDQSVTIRSIRECGIKPEALKQEIL